MIEAFPPSSVTVQGSFLPSVSHLQVRVLTRRFVMFAALDSQVILFLCDTNSNTVILSIDLPYIHVPTDILSDTELQSTLTVHGS